MSSTSSKNIVEDEAQQLKRKIDLKTKPLGSLGRLEDLALQIGMVQNTLSPVLTKPVLVVFAADHGIALSGVSPYPQEVTHQMVKNFIADGAAINVFCRQNSIALKVVDAGVNHDFDPELLVDHSADSVSDGVRKIINAKVAYGTKNFLHESAISPEQCVEARRHAEKIVEKLYADDSNIIGFGEMGISNTSSAAIIMHKICNIPLELCVGAGAGLDKEGVAKKLSILKQAVKRVESVVESESESESEPGQLSPLAVLRLLQNFGGFEIAMIAFAMLRATEKRMIILVDGFISSASFLVAHALDKRVMDCAIFCHLSDESGHKLMVDYLGVKPLLDIGLRLGEGTAAALSYPIVAAAVNFLNQMASFESANVSGPRQ
ncbi:MAG: nicotinate-nucleotide--dimethylbenzimidazole phosphoribosyltransferase [Oligoflexia bacterium]|nr:nicotinate-nucleotide--dimethylbenzimidazole phosphoribosyltransferase [Oligoflexia bacterium]